MRIAILAHAPDAGGAGRNDYLHRIVEALVASGHDARLLSPDGWNAIDPDTRVVVDSSAVPELGSSGKEIASATVTGLLRGTPAGTGEDTCGDAEPSASVGRDFYRSLTRVIVTAEAAGDWLRERHGLAPEAIRTVVPGTPDAPRATGSGCPGCAILSVGPLRPCAGHDALLRALARLFDLDWHVTLVGDPDDDPPHVSALEKLAGEFGLASRLSIAGRLSGAALEAAWMRADLFACASSPIVHGTPLADALRRGLPVAVVGDAAARALVGAEAGVVCAPGDRDTLSKSLRRMIFDGDLRREMAQAAWTIGRSLPDWPTQARAFARALDG